MYTPLGDPRETFWENHLPVMSFFFPPPFLGPQRSPGQNVGQRGPDLALDPKNKKMRAEKWCRTPPELIQTEPGGASYGQKPF